MKKIYITGASGWLGRAFTNALIHPVEDYKDEPVFKKYRKCQVALLVKPGEKKSLGTLPSHFKIHEGLLSDKKKLKTFFADAEKDSILFHLAGIIHPSLKVREFYEVNLQGTKNVISAASSQKIQKAVVMSSNSPLGCNSDNKTPFTEFSPYNPYMNYGRSKRLMEEYCLSPEVLKQIQIVIIRAPWFYGPFQPDRQTLFFKMIRDGKMPIVGDGENLRSMSYIYNLVYGLLLAADKDLEKNGEIFWIADKEAYSMNRIIDTVEKLLEKEFSIQCAHKRMKLPFLIGEVASLADAVIQKTGFYQNKIHVLSEMNKNIFCSVDKAQKKLGYEPKISLEEGMRKSLEYLAEKTGKSKPDLG